MMNKKRFLQSVLSKSMLVVAAVLPSEAAFAANITLTGTPAVQAVAVANMPVSADGDTIIAHAAADSVQLNQAGTYTLNGGNFGTVQWIVGQVAGTTYNFTAQTANKTNVLKLGVVGDSQGAGTNEVTINDTGVLLDKGILTVDMRNVAGTIGFRPGAGNTADHTGVTYQSTGGNNGTLVFGPGTVTMGTFSNGGATQVAAIAIDTAGIAKTSASVYTSGAATMYGDGQLIVNDTHNLTIAGHLNGDNAGEGIVEFKGASTVNNKMGMTQPMKHIKTSGAAGKLVTLTDDISTTKLTVGAGGITTAEDITVGTDGILSTATTAAITFTDSKSLTISGNNAAKLNVAAGKILTIKANADSTFTNSILAADATSNLTFTAGGAYAVTLEGNVGTEALPFAVVTLTGNNDDITLDSTMYATSLVLTDATSSINMQNDSDIVGTINPINDKGLLIVDGASVGSKEMHFGPGRLNSMLFMANVSNAVLTFGATDADPNTTINTVTFDRTTNGDSSGIVIDMSEVAAGNQNTKLTLGAINHTADGTRGTITFNGYTTANKDVMVTVEAAANLGTDTKRLKYIDAGDHKLTLDGNGGNNIYVSEIYASEVTLHGVNLGVFSIDDEKSPKIFNVTANSELITTSKITSAARPGTLKFNGDFDLTLNDKVEFHGAVLNSAGAGSHGTLVLGTGDSKVSVTKIGTSTDMLDAIQLKTGADKKAYIMSSGSELADVYSPIKGVVGLNAAATINLKNLRVHDSITNASGAVAGIINLEGTNVIDGSLGAEAAAQRFTEVIVNGETIVGKETANSGYGADATTFAAENSKLTLTKKVNGADVGLGAVTTHEDKDGWGILELNQDVTTIANEDLGSAKNSRLKKILIGENSTLTAGAAIHAVEVATTANEKSNVTMNFAFDGGKTTIGSANMRFDTVTSAGGAGNTTTLDKIYADSIAITSGTLAANRFDASGTDGTTVAAAATMQILDGGYATVIKGAATSILLVDGNATIDGNIDGAGVMEVTFSDVAGKSVSFNGTKMNANVEQGQSSLVLKNATEITGTATFNSSSLALAKDATLTSTGDLSIDGDITMGIVYTPDSDVILAGSAVTIADNTSFKLVLLPSKDLPKNGAKLSLIKKADGSAIDALTEANYETISIEVSGNRFVKDVEASDTLELTFIGKTKASEIFPASLLKDVNANSMAEAFVANITSANPDAKLSEFAALISTMSDSEVEETVSRLTARDVDATTTCAMEALSSATQSATARTNALMGAGPDALGVAAGDTAEKFGVWGQATLGTATQKLRKNTSGYKTNSYGATVGVDTMLSDASSLGIFAGNANSNIKHKDVKAGDKTKANSWIFGVYGNYDFANDFFVQANAAIAQTAIKAKSQRVTGAAKTVATGKYDVMGYAAEVRGGYKFKFENTQITPTLGVRYNYLGDTSYTETGAGVQNLKVAGKSAGAFSAVAGVMLGTSVDVNGSIIMPEVHVNVDYALSNPASKSNYSLDGSSVTFNYKGAKPSRFGYNFGTSVMAQNDNVEYGVGYDARISDKYLGHQGAVKVKLKF